jgi:hypothetical protein
MWIPRSAQLRGETENAGSFLLVGEGGKNMIEMMDSHGYLDNRM